MPFPFFQLFHSSPLSSHTRETKITHKAFIMWPLLTSQPGPPPPPLPQRSPIHFCLQNFECTSFCLEHSPCCPALLLLQANGSSFPVLCTLMLLPGRLPWLSLHSETELVPHLCPFITPSFRFFPITIFYCNLLLCIHSYIVMSWELVL